MEKKTLHSLSFEIMYRGEEAFYSFIRKHPKTMFQVAPAELEEIIRDYPDVEEAGVIGIPHSSLGEAPKAFVVLKPGAKIDCDKLMKYVKNKVAPYKQLVGGVSVVDSIPKNATGKILRRELKSQHHKNSNWNKSDP